MSGVGLDDNHTCVVRWANQELTYEENVQKLLSTTLRPVNTW